MNYNKKNNGRIAALFFTLSFFALVGLFGTGYLISTMPDNFLFISLFCACVLILALTISTLIINAIYKKHKIDSPRHNDLLSIIYERVRNLEEPAFICDNHGKILWNNPFMQKVCGQKCPVLGSYTSNFFEGDILECNDLSNITFANKNYRVERTYVKIATDVYYVFVFRDITHECFLEKKLKDTDKLVAFVVVDNLEELLQFEQDTYRKASAQIGELVCEWAESLEGIYKEYEKDKYMVIFDARHLERLMTERLDPDELLEGEVDEDGFNILKNARKILVGTAGIHVTLSIGIAYSSIEDSILKKEKASHACLEMALQRGGDQAAVKIDNNFKYFGAKFSAVQRRSRVKARIVANELVRYIDDAENVIIMAHKFPDYDAIGASIGIAKLCKFRNKTYNIVTNFNDLNVKKSLKLFNDDEEWNGIFVDGATALDNKSDGSLLILVDVNSASMVEYPDLLSNVNNHIIIDHHRKTDTSDSSPLVSYIETSASSASELVTEMLEQIMPANMLKQNEANMLLAGILLDTKQLTKNTGSKTYGAAMYLRDLGACYDNVASLFKTSLEDYQQESKYGELVEIYNDCMAIVVKEHGTTKADRILAARVADNLLKINDVEASFVLVKIDKVVHVFARSCGSVNVHLILEEMGGGGHFNVAGGQFTDENMESVVARLKTAINNHTQREEPK